MVGEVGGESAVMLQAMNTGAVLTLHAGTAQEAILRLVLCQFWRGHLQKWEQRMATALDLIVVKISRWKAMTTFQVLFVQDQSKYRGGVVVMRKVAFVKLLAHQSRHKKMDYSIKREI